MNPDGTNPQSTPQTADPAASTGPTPVRDNLTPSNIYYQQDPQQMVSAPPPVPEPVPIAPVAPQPQSQPELLPEVSPLAQPAIEEVAPKQGFPVKKILLIALAVLVVLGIVLVLSSLFRSRKSGTTSKETTITWWGLWDEEQVVKPLIDEYQAQNPKVKVIYVRNSSKDYRERLTSALAKGTGAPDIFRMHATWLPMFVKEISPVPESVISPADMATNYYPSTAFFSLKDSFAGVPMGYDGLQMFVNEDLFTKANLTPPKTWFELRDTAKTLTKVENGIITQAGVALGEVANTDHWQDIVGLMLLQNRVDLNNLADTKAQDVFKFWAMFSKNYGVWDKSLPSSTAYFASGKLAIYFGPSWRALNIKELNPKLKFKAVALPQLPKASPTDPDITYASYWIESVWERSPNKDVAWNFVKFISSRESLEKIYQNATKVRGMGSAYPYVDMAGKLTDSLILGPLVADAPNAQMWYLSSRTFDGTTGINSQISKYFEDGLNSIAGSGDVKGALETVAAGVAQVKTQYGIK